MKKKETGINRRNRRTRRRGRFHMILRGDDSAPMASGLPEGDGCGRIDTREVSLVWKSAHIDKYWKLRRLFPLMKAKAQPYGSQRLLQVAVNKRPELLLSALRRSGAVGRRETLEWISPLESEGHCEYRDQAAIKKLRIDKSITSPLSDFWPRRGAVWDGLAVTSKRRPLLVEAKAHIPEAASPGTKASPASLELIEKSLIATRKHLAPRGTAMWTGTFYQYANRLAYQYWLRELNGIDSSLVFLDFTNAVDMDGPTSVAEWRGATRMIHAVLGLPVDLEHFGVYHAYVDARQLTDTE